jgi:hypothetical protein
MIEQLHHEIEQLRYQLAHPELIVARFRHKVQTPDGRIGLCLSGGTLVWVLYLMSAYPVASLACEAGWLAQLADGAGLKIIETILTVIAAGLVAGAAYLVFIVWQRARTADNHEISEAPTARIPMLALVTLLLNCLFLLIILISLAPIVTLPACA